jgi:RimJ/RimL family protein N-acetyltransferase
MKNPFLIGSRVYLRPLESEDAASLQPWVNDEEVARTVAFHRPLTLADERAFVERTRSADHEIVLAIALQRGDRMIGDVGLHAIHSKDRSAVLGIMIGDKKEWGKGYGTEATALMVRYAFETMNLNRVSLHVFEFNVRGIRAYEKVGFRQEAIFRQAVFREGRYWNTIGMAILRDEWSRGRENGPAKKTKPPRRRVSG